jgi:tRNA-2-methylthio-N6-dimethylallyladenosine synthase
VDENTKSDRLATLQALLDSQQRAFNEGCVGRVMGVLFDDRGRAPGQLIGRSPYMQPVHAQALDSLLGTIQPLRITGAFANSLAGVLTGSATA